MIIKMGFVAIWAFALVTNVFSQRGPIFDPPSKLKVRGDIVAEDSVSPIYYLEGYPPNRTFLVRISSVTEGTEPAEFVFITTKKQSFIKAVRAGKYHFKMGLIRSKACDSSLQDLSRAAAESGSGRSSSPLTWLTRESDLTPEKQLPCYILIDGDFKSVKRLGQ